MSNLTLRASRSTGLPALRTRNRIATELLRTFEKVVADPAELTLTLLEAASWACPQLGPFVRQAVGVAARRGLANAVLATHVLVPPPPPVAVPVAVRPQLTPWSNAAAAGGVTVRPLP